MNGWRWSIACGIPGNPTRSWLIPKTGVFADYTKIHPIDFEGRFYKCRGPLNTAPGPQRRPVICQAGGSPAGLAFAAVWLQLGVPVRFAGVGERPEDLVAFDPTAFVAALFEEAA